MFAHSDECNLSFATPIIASAAALVLCIVVTCVVATVWIKKRRKQFNYVELQNDED